MAIRLRRIRADYRKLKEKCRDNPYISIKRTRGNPPEFYVIEYHVKGVSITRGDKIEIRDVHEVGIMLPKYYPRVSPKCRMLTPVFHPNIDELAICIGDHWSASETLSQLVVRIGEMIAYQSYNIKSPINKRAARWAAQNESRFPIDSSYINFKEDVPENLQEKVEEIEIKVWERDDAEGLVQIVSLEERKPDTGEATERVPETFAIERCSNCLVDSSEEELSRCVEGHLTCKNCELICSRCGRKHCLSCTLYRCSSCGAMVCSFCASPCLICRKPRCKEHMGKCQHCGMLVCEDCLFTCSQCQKVVCRTHAKICPDCKKELCLECALKSHDCQPQRPLDKK